MPTGTPPIDMTPPRCPGPPEGEPQPHSATAASGQAADRSTAGLPQTQRRGAMAALLAAVAMATLDSAITNTALPTMAADLHASAASSIWIINAYQLAMVAALLPLASLGEIAGHRRVYLGGLVLFTTASLLCGLSWSLPALAAARVVQGLGAAAVMSVNTALIRHIFPSERLARGIAWNTLTVAVFFAIGPTLASAILSIAHWHWLFLINVPVGLGVVVLALRTLPATPPSGHAFDPLAATTCALTFAVLIFAMGEAAHLAPGTRVVTELVIAVLALVWLLRRQAGHPAPMLPTDLFRIPIFTLSALTAVSAFAAWSMGFVALPFLFEDTLGRTAVESGFLLTPWPAMLAVMAPISAALLGRFPAGLLGGVGLITMAAGLALLAALPAQPGDADIVWRMMLCGAGFGFFQSPNMKTLIASAPARRSGSASGIIAVARILGMAMGAAATAACFALAGRHGATVALYVGAGWSLIASAASLLRLTPAGRGR